MIIDHVGVSVSDVIRSREFYLKCLKPLGIELMAQEGENVGFGKDGIAPFWIGTNKETTRRIHIAFVADNRSQVRAFYEEALAAGGKDNGPPGIREIYHPNYYAAFVLDPDGYNIEAVCRKPE